MCSLMWFRKKRPTPHFKVLCGGASRSSSSEESSESRAQTREVASTFGAYLTLEEFSPLRKHKSQYGKCRHNCSHSDGNNFPTQVNLYYEDMPEAADSKSSPELETHSVRRRAFLGTKKTDSLLEVSAL